MSAGGEDREDDEESNKSNRSGKDLGCLFTYRRIEQGLLKVWTKGYSDHRPKSGPELAIYHCIKSCRNNFTQSSYL